jgi:hypothetical protein
MHQCHLRERTSWLGAILSSTIIVLYSLTLKVAQTYQIRLVRSQRWINKHHTGDLMAKLRLKTLISLSCSTKTHLSKLKRCIRLRSHQKAPKARVFKVYSLTLICPYIRVGLCSRRAKLRWAKNCHAVNISCARETG